MNLIRTVFAAGCVTTALGGVSAASDRAFWDGLPRWAYYEVYSYACEPVELDLEDRVTPAPQGVAAVIHEELFLATYGASCRDFYFEEVVGRYQGPFAQVQAPSFVDR